MRKTTVRTGLRSLMGALPGRAELLQVDLSIFGMD